MQQKYVDEWYSRIILGEKEHSQQKKTPKFYMEKTNKKKTVEKSGLTMEYFDSDCCLGPHIKNKLSQSSSDLVDSGKALNVFTE